MYIQDGNYNIGRLVENKGLPWFLKNICGTLMESVGDADPVLMPEDFSFKEIFEAVDSSTFPVITGQIISKKMIAAYITAAKTGDFLCTNMKSNKQIDRITGFDRVNRMKRTGEGMPYDRTGRIDEKWVEIRGDKYGEILDVTEEAIMFDQTNQILREAMAIAEDAALDREYHIMQTIQDQTGYKAWHPSGNQVDLYSTSTTAPHDYSNQVANVLADHTDIDAVNQLFAGMKNKNGRPTIVVPKILLVPMALDMTARTLMSSPVMLEKYNATPNPVKGDFQLVSTPYLDTTSSAYWYLGDFKKQFVWKEVIPFQVKTRKRGTDDDWDRDIVASVKCRYYGECGALDYRYVVRSVGTT